LRERELKLALAESCTGGLLGSLITDVPGSSDYFLGSAVAYAYSAKQSILGVRQGTLEEYGAVSPQTAAEMALGARRLFGTEIGVSVTGIAAYRRPVRQAGGPGIHSLVGADCEMGERYV
jgi:nicotinamide-nucleotide amidase